MAKSSGMSLKLLIDKKAQKVVFAEADKKFVDFLFDILSLPLASVVKLMKKNLTTAEAAAGSISNIYKSVESMTDAYLQPNHDKDTILKPKFKICSSTKLLLDIESSDTTYYFCHNDEPTCLSCVSDGRNAICPGCECYMTAESIYVKPQSFDTVEFNSTEEDDRGGHIRGVVTYMVMDDLTVKPMSAISSIALLNNFNIKEVDALEEKVITLDVNQGVKLLKVALLSETVLTDVFLEKVKEEQAINDAWHMV